LLKYSNQFMLSNQKLFQNCVILFLLSFIVYNLNLSYETSGDTRAAELTPITIIKDFDLDFSEFFSDNGQTHSQYWFYRVEPTGKVVSVYPVLPGILAVPIYYFVDLLGFDITAHTKLLSKITSSLIASLAVVFMYLALSQIFRPKTSLFMALIFGFATNIWTVASRGLWQHGPSVLFINISLFLLFLGQKKSKYLAWVGFFAGWAIWSRPSDLLLFLPIFIYICVHHRKQIIKFLILGSIPIGLLFTYSYIYYHQFKNLGQAQVYHFTNNIFNGLLGLFFSPSHGLLTHSPIFIFAFVAIYFVFTKKEFNPLYKYISIGTILLWLLYSKWVMWWGGWGFGYRLLIEMLPGLLVLLAIFWEKLLDNKNIILKYFFVILVCLSFYIEIIGAFFSPCRMGNTADDVINHRNQLWDWKNHPIFSCQNAKSLEDPGKYLHLLYKDKFDKKRKLNESQ